MDLENAHNFAGKLYDWYWDHGIERDARFAIPVSNWVSRLLRIRDELAALPKAVESRAPSIAVWGPSQTGKSTLLSGYLDARAVLDPEHKMFGCGSSLDWTSDWTEGAEQPGQDPVVFMKFDDDLNLHTLNPKREGKDASACLSRFYDGKVNPPQNPRYPVEVKLVSLEDLPLILARGYNSECLGPLKDGRQRNWTLDTLVEAINRARKGKNYERPSRDAVEFLVNFQRIMESMVFAGLPRFAHLEEEGSDEWRTRLNAILDDLEFTGSLERAEELAAEILWDGAAKITQAYRGLSRVIRKVTEMWKGKRVLCDFRVAAILLDMESFQIAYKGVPPEVHPESRDREIERQLKQLAYREEDDCVILGVDESLPHRVSLTPFDFGAFQSLVWELKIPINTERLPDSQFKSFLAECDLLDFPGVGRETKTLQTRINLGFPGVEVSPHAPIYSDVLLFGEIVKRGKTSSIVSTFARRGEIDGFNIFSNVDGDPIQKSDELLEGVNTWWKSMAIDYYTGGRKGPSPLPLNVALLWWRKLVNEASKSSAGFMKKVQDYYKNLGDIANPEISNFFGLNYYGFDRGDLKRDKIEIFREIITREEEFVRVFGASDVSVGRKSFETMLSDFDSGGADFFFAELLKQAQNYQERQRAKGGIQLDRSSELTDLLQWKGLFPEPEPRDSRKDSLKRLIEAVDAAVEGRTEDELMELNALLRYVFDVDYTDLDEVDSDPFTITDDFVRRQFTEKWAEKKLQSYESWLLKGPKAKRNWGLLDFESKDEVRELLVDGLAGSVERDFGEITEFMRGLVQFSGHGTRNSRMGDLRRHLAVRMGNYLVYGEMGPPRYVESGGPREDGVLNMDSDRRRGKECFYYECFIEPLEEQLDRLLKLDVAARERPTEIPGDKELVELCRAFQNQPFIQTEEGLTTILTKTDFETR